MRAAHRLPTARRPGKLTGSRRKSFQTFQVSNPTARQRGGAASPGRAPATLARGDAGWCGGGGGGSRPAERPEAPRTRSTRRRPSLERPGRASPHLAGRAGRAGGAFLRAGGKRQPLARPKPASRTHPASPTPKPTPGARAQRRRRLSRGRAGVLGSTSALGSPEQSAGERRERRRGGARRRAHRSSQSARSKWPAGAGRCSRGGARTPRGGARAPGFFRPSGSCRPGLASYNSWMRRPGHSCCLLGGSRAVFLLRDFKCNIRKIMCRGSQRPRGRGSLCL